MKLMVWYFVILTNFTKLLLDSFLSGFVLVWLEFTLFVWSLFTCFCGVLSAITWILFSKSNRGSIVAANHNHVSGYSRAIPQRIHGTLGWLLIDRSVMRRKVLRIPRPSHVWIYNVSFHLMGMMNFTTRKAHSKCLCTPISLCFVCERVFLCLPSWQSVNCNNAHQSKFPFDFLVFYSLDRCSSNTW
jgi:hypothetical protein